MIDAPHDFESSIPQYPVRLDNFEGPLDLLVHLIRRHEIDIYDIPIALITEQYLEYLELMQELDLDVAGEFLVMAATLIQIKARMLVPRPEAADEEEDAGDPRDALVQRLLEHEKYKAAAELLHERQTERSAQWTRPDSRVADIAGQPIEREIEVDLFSLLQAFQAVMARARERRPLELPEELVSIERRIEQLNARLSETEACGFEDLFEGDRSRSELVTTFLALLEMVRLKLVRLFQSGPFAPIRVYRRVRPADAPRPQGATGDA
ncbi:MAG: segregation/condensation protein A [Acidobacteria bacterium]|nr:segregation/condensation protein A [Acidobacteriota bacterium]